jgi:hypothetical protein
LYLILRKYFFESFNGQLAYIIYKIINNINKTKFAILLKFSSKLSHPSIIEKKHNETSFYYYFNIPDLKEAYTYRLNYSLSLYCSAKQSALKEQVKNYLNVMLDNDVITFFKLEKNLLDYFYENNSDNFTLINTSIFKKKHIPKLLLVGPSADISKLNYAKYDYIAFTKPLVDNSRNINISDKKLIIILNNQWSHDIDGLKMPMRQVTIDWIKKNVNATVFTPFKLCEFKNEIHYQYKDIFQSYYPKASPQGLQRSLTLLLNEYDILKLELNGFDFMLSETSYKSWYPSTTEKYYGSRYPGFMVSNINHDFLFNFMYVKKLKQQFGDRIYGSIDPYLEMSIGDVIDLFEKRMNALGV